jgi:two-component system response regulator FlrC
VAFNCAALPEHLIEDMLFGHERGAFTGAHREHKGLFEQAHGGTLFLDEIGDMPMHLQARLLRVLQERQITRLGGSAVITLDVRVVAATAQDLKAAISEKRFREDLYYRISTFLLQLAPLRDRPSDILPLAISMLQRHPAPGAARWEITEAAAHRLLSHAWPGNVRELDNVIRRAVVLADGARIGLSELVFDDVPGGTAGMSSNAALQPSAAYPNWRAADMAELSTVAENSPARTDQRQALPLDPSFDAQPGGGTSASMRPPAGGALTDAVRENEMRIVRATLESCASRDEAARRLGISPRTLRHKLAQWRQLGLMAA